MGMEDVNLDKIYGDHTDPQPGNPPAEPLATGGDPTPPEEVPEDVKGLFSDDEGGGDGGKTGEPQGDGEPKKTEPDTGEPPAGKDDTGTDEGGEKDEFVEVEGFKIPSDMTVDTDLLNQFKALGEEKGLDQEVLQSFLDLSIKHLESIAEEGLKELESMKQEWLEEAKPQLIEEAKATVLREVEAKHQETLRAWRRAAAQDEILGGSKENQEKVQATIEKVLTKFGDKELWAHLKETGLHWHPAFARFVARVGQVMSEDRFVQGKTGVPQKEPWEKMYK